MGMASVIQTIWKQDLEQTGHSTILSVRAGLVPQIILDDPNTGQRVELDVTAALMTPQDAQHMAPMSADSGISVSVNGRSGELAAHSFAVGTDSSHGFLDGIGFAGNMIALHHMTVSGQDWLMAAPTYGEGLSSYHIDTSDVPHLMTQMDAKSDAALSSISALSSLMIEDTPYVLAASMTQDLISILKLGSNGELSKIDTIGTKHNLPIDCPTAISTVSIGSQTFVIVASSGTASLTVLEITQAATLEFVEQINDTRGTRFGGASALDTVMVDGRAYVAAAGNDGGVSLFQMLPGGRLVHQQTLIDQNDTGLDGISSLRFVHRANGLDLFALSTRDAGLTRIAIDVAAAGITGAVSVGTQDNDILSGASGTSYIKGYGGDDILLDSAGETNLYGGDGADVFIFNSDNARDVIFDFDPAQDRIDLSGTQTVRSISDLDILAISVGLRIAWGDDILVVRSASGAGLTQENLGTAIAFEVDRVAMIERSPLIGTADADTFLWALGDDSIDGGAGRDHIDYSDAPQAVVVNLERTAQNGLAAQGDTIVNVQDVTGTRYDDHLIGDGSDNTLRAQLGHDSLYGGDGNDWLMPGDGRATVDGGSGVNMLSLSDMSTSARVSLADGTISAGGHNGTVDNIANITGTIFADVIEGDAGSNRLRGLGDFDWFLGTQGSDSYDGGNGRDMISYVYAPEAVTVNLAMGQGLAGLASGDTYTSIERVTGSIYGDVIYGGAADEDLRGVGGYDWFIGSLGRDRFDGGSGVDTVAYWTSPVGVDADLFRGVGSLGDAARDLYTSIENLTGSSHDDILTGDNGRNALRGLGGDDVLFANGGVDRLEGGSGNDTLDGGWGWDIAIFSGARSEYDVAALVDGQWIVTDSKGWRDGTDQLDNIEALQFSDGLFHF